MVKYDTIVVMTERRKRRKFLLSGGEKVERIKRMDIEVEFFLELVGIRITS